MLDLHSLPGRYSAAALPKLAAQIHRMTSQASSWMATPPASTLGDTSAARPHSRFQREDAPAKEAAYDESHRLAAPALAEDASSAAVWVPDSPDGATLREAEHAAVDKFMHRKFSESNKRRRQCRALPKCVTARRIAHRCLLPLSCPFRYFY